MIKYRNSTKGSYDGLERIHEIESLDTEKMTDGTKALLLCILVDSCNFDLLRLKNLVPLLKTKPLKNSINLNNYDESRFHPVYALYNINYGGVNNFKMKLGIKEFYRNVQKLDNLLEKEVIKGNLEENFKFEVECVGGFAMSYYGIRGDNVTEDMDSLVEINDIVHKCVSLIAQSESLSIDWINDIMINKFGYSEDNFHWKLTDL